MFLIHHDKCQPGKYAHFTSFHRTALSFPVELGGAALGDAQLSRLQQCPPADSPCDSQANTTVFATLGPAGER